MTRPRDPSEPGEVDARAVSFGVIAAGAGAFLLVLALATVGFMIAEWPLAHALGVAAALAAGAATATYQALKRLKSW